jgi:hypothetical protein
MRLTIQVIRRDMKNGPYLAGFYPPSPDDISLEGMMPDRKSKAEPANK